MKKKIKKKLAIFHLFFHIIYDAMSKKYETRFFFSTHYSGRVLDCFCH